MSEMDEYNEFSNDGVDDLEQKKNNSKKDRNSNHSRRRSRNNDRKKSDASDSSHERNGSSEQPNVDQDQPNYESEPIDQSSLQSDNDISSPTSNQQDTGNSSSENGANNQNTTENNANPKYGDAASGNNEKDITPNNMPNAENNESGSNPDSLFSSDASKGLQANNASTDTFNPSKEMAPNMDATGGGSSGFNTMGGGTGSTSEISTSALPSSGATGSGSAASGAGAGATAGAEAGASTAAAGTTSGVVEGTEAVVAATGPVGIFVAIIVGVIALIVLLLCAAVLTFVIFYTISPKNVVDGDLRGTYNTREEAEQATNAEITFSGVWDTLMNYLWGSNVDPEKYENLISFEKMYKQEKVKAQKAMLKSFDASVEEAKEYIEDNELLLGTITPRLSFIFTSRNVNYGDIMAAVELNALVNAEDEWEYYSNAYDKCLSDDDFIAGLTEITYVEREVSVPVIGNVIPVTIKYTDIVIKPFTKDSLYEAIGVDPNDSFDGNNPNAPTYEDLWQQYLKTYKEFSGKVDLNLETQTRWRDGAPPSDPRDDDMADRNTLGVPRLFQGDYPTTWKPISGSGGCYIPREGCFLTCVAMICSYCSESTVTPVDLANKSEYSKFVDSSGCMAYDGPKTMIEEYGGNCSRYYRTRYNYAYLIKELDYGKVAIVKLNSNTIYTSSTHYIVITGHDENGDFYVNDPNKRNYTEYGEIYPAENVTLGATYMYTFYK